jgi:AcrR family transcriptional regulator
VRSAFIGIDDARAKGRPQLAGFRDVIARDHRRIRSTRQLPLEWRYVRDVARTKDRAPSARRVPTTAHGLAVVDRVIDAAHRLLAEEGYDAMSTNRVAALAGISVGSLYHYFPTKEAIVAELARRLETRGLELAIERFLQPGATVEDLIEGVVGILLSDAIGIIGARRTLLRRVPPRWYEDASLAADREVRGWVAALIEGRRSELREGSAALMAFVAYHALEGVVEAAVEHAPELVRDPAFADELAKMIARYVRGSSTARSDAQNAR